MSPPSPFTPPEPSEFQGYVISVARGDRWVMYQRLQELDISCACPFDGSLRADVSTGMDILLIRSMVLRMTAARSDLMTWLERCWHSELHSIGTPPFIAQSR